MKKLLLGFAIIGMISLASCSKEKDCKCTTSIDGVEMSSATVTIDDGKCSDMNITVTTGPSTSKTECKEV